MWVLIPSLLFGICNSLSALPFRRSAVHCYSISTDPSCPFLLNDRDWSRQHLTPAISPNAKFFAQLKLTIFRFDEFNPGWNYGLEKKNAERNPDATH